MLAQGARWPLWPGVLTMCRPCVLTVRRPCTDRLLAVCRPQVPDFEALRLGPKGPAIVINDTASGWVLSENGKRSGRVRVCAHMWAGVGREGGGGGLGCRQRTPVMRMDATLAVVRTATPTDGNELNHHCCACFPMLPWRPPSHVLPCAAGHQVLAARVRSSESGMPPNVSLDVL